MHLVNSTTDFRMQSSCVYNKILQIQKSTPSLSCMLISIYIGWLQISRKKLLKRHMRVSRFHRVEIRLSYLSTAFKCTDNLSYRPTFSWTFDAYYLCSKGFCILSNPINLSSPDNSLKKKKLINQPIFSYGMMLDIINSYEISVSSAYFKAILKVTLRFYQIVVGG